MPVLTACIRRIASLVLLAMLLFCAPAWAAKTGATSPGGFDHAKTGFPLTGAHRTARCEGCHDRGILRGTPKDCTSCHGNGSRLPDATRPSASHIPISSGCEACHRTSGWIPAIFDHATVADRTCASCHNGSTATGKPARHIVTSQGCDACHRTSAWTPAKFDHRNVTAGS